MLRSRRPAAGAAPRRAATAPHLAPSGTSTRSTSSRRRGGCCRPCSRVTRMLRRNGIGSSTWKRVHRPASLPVPVAVVVQRGAEVGVLHVLHAPALAEVLLLAGAVQGAGGTARRRRTPCRRPLPTSRRRGCPRSGGSRSRCPRRWRRGSRSCGRRVRLGPSPPVGLQWGRRAGQLAAPVRVEVAGVRRQALPALVVYVPEGAAPAARRRCATRSGRARRTAS